MEIYTESQVSLTGCYIIEAGSPHPSGKSGSCTTPVAGLQQLPPWSDTQIPGSKW
jgi:hypothetical protein